MPAVPRTNADAAQSSADVARQLQRAIVAAALLPDFPLGERRELLRRRGVVLRDTGSPDGRTTLVEAARLADVQGDLHALAEILGGLDVESLWAGYDWSLHDLRVVAIVERALAQPALTHRDRTQLTMALAGELTYLDNARSNQLFADARAMAELLQDAVLSARILLRWFWSVSGPSGVRERGPGAHPHAPPRAGPTCSSPRPVARCSTATWNEHGPTPRRCGPLCSGSGTTPLTAVRQASSPSLTPRPVTSTPPSVSSPCSSPRPTADRSGGSRRGS